MSLGDREAFLNTLWSDDLLGRRELAQKLEDYITGRFANPAPGGGSFTIAVEGPYGQGKSFFLDRLGKQLSYSHPVAFVNAWADDTADDPLTSLFLAIETGLSEKIKSQDESKRRTVAAKLKSVAKIAAKVAVRAAGVRLLTKEGIEELEGAFESGVDDLFDLKTESAPTAQLVSRRTLISEFRDRLSSLLDALEEDGLFKRPLIVIIDELDRCRPTYAVRILEEAKHFFDDTGTIFLYGMNKVALCATVRSIYGHTFPAEHYLARFVRRQVHMPATSLTDIISQIFRQNPVIMSRVMFIDDSSGDDSDQMVPWLSSLFSMNNIYARDAEYIIERMFSFAAIWTYKAKIHLPYLALIAVKHYRRERLDDVAVSDQAPPVSGVRGDILRMRYEQIGSWSIVEIHNELSRGTEFNPLLSSVVKEYGARSQPTNSGEFDMDFRSYLGQYSIKFEEVGKFIDIVAAPADGDSLGSP